LTGWARTSQTTQEHISTFPKPTGMLWLNTRWIYWCCFIYGICPVSKWTKNICFIFFNVHISFTVFYYNQRMHYYTAPFKHLKCLRKNHSYMFRSASDHHQGVKLYLAKNYSATIVVFPWVLAMRQHSQYPIFT
jgi:hypothetical protein